MENNKITTDLIKKISKIIQAKYSPKSNFSKYYGYPIGVPIKIFIFGCGGTGSWFIPKFFKILNNMKNHNSIEIILVDGDIVEKRNIKRQNFVEKDVGFNKAMILNNRYEPLLIKKSEIKTYVIDKYVVNNEAYKEYKNEDKFTTLDLILPNFINTNYGNNLVLFIDLLDNGITRKLIHSYAIFRGIKIISVGNKEFNGQLIFNDFSLNFFNSYMKNIIKFNELQYLYYEQLPEQLNDNSNIDNSLGCGGSFDLNSELKNKQSVIINDTSALILSNFIMNWFYLQNDIINTRIDYKIGNNIRVESSNPVLNDIFYNKFFNEKDKNIISTIRNKLNEVENEQLDCLLDYNLASKYADIFLKEYTDKLPK